jgi:two-component system LytT family response regulator
MPENLKYKYLIVEDEPDSAERLRLLLGKIHPEEFEFGGWAKDKYEAIRLIELQLPDLVFLDVQLRNAKSFEVLEELEELDFEIIFTTGHPEFAIEAIRVEALDYLLKPIDRDDLKNAIDRFLERKRASIYSPISKEIVFGELRNGKQKIGIPTTTGIEFLAVSEIIRCQADGNYSLIFMRDKSKILVSKTLKDFELSLGPHGFFRIHNSHLVNLSEVRSYQRGKGGYLVLNDHTELEVASRRKMELLERLKNI